MTNPDSRPIRPSTAMERADVANGEGSPDHPARCVLIAVDESPSSVDVARAALRLVGPDARYVLVNVGSRDLAWVVDDPMMWGLAPPAMVTLSPPGDVARIRMANGDESVARPDPEADAEATASAVALSAGLADAETVGTVARDHTEAVLEVAREHEADVIVLGNKHRNWLDRFFRGSLTNDVVKRSDFPVLLVP